MYCTYDNEVFEAKKRSNLIIILDRVSMRKLESEGINIFNLPSCMKVLFGKEGNNLVQISTSSVEVGINLSAFSEVYIDGYKVETVDRSGNVWRGKVHTPLEGSCIFKIGREYSAYVSEIGMLEDKCILALYSEGRRRIVFVVGDRLR